MFGKLTKEVWCSGKNVHIATPLTNTQIICTYTDVAPVALQTHTLIIHTYADTISNHLIFWPERNVSVGQRCDKCFSERGEFMLLLEGPDSSKLN